MGNLEKYRQTIVGHWQNVLGQFARDIKEYEFDDSSYPEEVIYKIVFKDDDTKQYVVTAKVVDL